MKAKEIIKYRKKKVVRIILFFQASFDVEYYYDEGYFWKAEYDDYLNGTRTRQQMAQLYLHRMLDYYYSFVYTRYVLASSYDEWSEEYDEEYYRYERYYELFIDGQITYDDYIVELEDILSRLKNVIENHHEDDDDDGGGGGGGDYPDEPEE